MKEKRAKALVKKGRVVRQVAVLPVREGRDGSQVMLLTSRETKRFVLPKGWPMKGRKDHTAAAIEAKQEAGLIGRVSKDPIGTYSYWKRMRSLFIPVTVHVFWMDVETEKDDYRERAHRQRAWLSPAQAAALVDEPKLVSLFAELAQAPLKRLRASVGAEMHQLEDRAFVGEYRHRRRTKDG